METFKINRKSFWNKLLGVDEAEGIEAITILYSFDHGITGEKRHYIRIDGIYSDKDKIGNKILRPISDHEIVSDSDLQDMRKYIIKEDL